MYCCSKHLFMACNGTTPSFFPSSNFIFQIRTPLQHQQQQQEETQELIPSTITSLLRLNPPRSQSMPFSGLETAGGAAAAAPEEDLSDEEGGCSPAGGEKKRRLNSEQVRALEKSFALGNKLEPARKMQLARAVGLRPRQVAIWFQNRRARWKTKQLEKDFDVLKKELQAVKAENEALHEHNKKLQAEIASLKGKETADLINLNKESEVSCSNRSSDQNSSAAEVNLDDISRGASSAVDISSCAGGSLRQIFPCSQSSIRQPEPQPANNDEEELQAEKESSNPELGSFNNLLLCSLGDQSSSFWPWTDSHNFH